MADDGQQRAAGRPLVVVVMGVSGSGKTTVARELADRLGAPFAEADEFHPRANIEKMEAGTPLTDDDRWPWLERVGGWIGDREREGGRGVVTCSALKRAYRDVLRRGNPDAWFLHLTASQCTIAERMTARHGHFMPASLLDSQFATLEPLGPDEPGAAVDVGHDQDAVLDEALAAVRAAERETDRPS